MATEVVKWDDDVEPSDYEAAEHYLTLRFTEGVAEHAVRLLKEADIEERRANDILRAARLSPLAQNDPGVVHTEHKIRKDGKLSPILLVDFANGGADIADGYHRVSAIYQLDPFGMVPVKIAHVS